MKTVCKMNQCAGCMACVDICPRDAIRVEDSLSEYNAIIEEDKCIKCNLCHKVCQECNSPIFRSPILWRQGWAKEENIRCSSSSGGFAAAIEKAFVKQGGIVCSCVFEKGLFKFSCEEKEENLSKFSGSKYVKSNPEGIYKKILCLLKAGRKVLFVGLPCQAAAVKNYIGDYQNLYTVDLICHGTPSPKILDLFLQDHNSSLNEIKSLEFRTKDNYGLKNKKIKFAVPTVRDHYTMAFLNATICTNNCYQCKYAKLERISDLTLGDSWGSDLPEEQKRKGISLALCQTEKGQELLQQANLNLVGVDLKKAVQNNCQLNSPSNKPCQRKKFFNMLKKGKRFHWIIFRCYPVRYIKDLVKTFLYRLKNTY